LAAVSCAMIAISRFGSERTRSAVAWSCYLAVAACFVASASLARSTLRAALANEQPELHIVDIATSPLPGNPLCWTALVVGQQGSDYRVLSANVAPFPSVVDAASCPYDSDSRPTAHITTLPPGQRAELRWHWSYSTPLSSLRELAQHDCRFRAWLGFVRIPSVSIAVLPNGSGTMERVATDLRYDRAPELDFADLRLDRETECPKWLPPWQPPRAALLELR
ncbi:MAG TPA: hypothetical protein VMF89_35710, partial [Polyangiales bacterium]|nr:hypothetical protein [Polyangiales bacterium]